MVPGPIKIVVFKHNYYSTITVQLLCCCYGIFFFSELGCIYLTPFTDHVTGLKAVFSSKKYGPFMNEDVKPHHTLTLFMQRNFWVNVGIFSCPDSAVRRVYNAFQLEMSLIAPQNMPKPRFIYLHSWKKQKSRWFSLYIYHQRAIRANRISYVGKILKQYSIII